MCVFPNVVFLVPIPIPLSPSLSPCPPPYRSPLVPISIDPPLSPSLALYPCPHPLQYPLVPISSDIPYPAVPQPRNFLTTIPQALHMNISKPGVPADVGYQDLSRTLKQLVLEFLDIVG